MSEGESGRPAEGELMPRSLSERDGALGRTSRERGSPRGSGRAAPRGRRLTFQGGRRRPRASIET